ncbi:MAG TPA: hypothetical protein VI248_11820 [Kineosporiaceae bacterium]
MHGVVAGVAVALLLAGCARSMQEAGAAQGVELPTSDPAVTKTRAVAGEQHQTRGGRWLSGASGPLAANGTFGAWRKAPLGIGGDWENDNDAQVTMSSVCPGGQWGRWNKPLDLAVGAIEKRKGESWAKAARGAYDARWRRSWLRLKQCWGTRDPAYLYVRFAHEMNLGSMQWSVAAGEEADFVAAIKRFSDLRYEIMPRASLVLCPSDGTDGDLKLDVRTLWPGRDAKGRLVANLYAVDTYNGYVVVRNGGEFVTKATRLDDRGWLFGIETHRAFAESLGVPFAVSEWSNNGDPQDAGRGGEAPDYVRLMNDYFREHAGDPAHPKAGQLLYEIQFNILRQFTLLPTKLQPETAAAYRSLAWGR